MSVGDGAIDSSLNPVVGGQEEGPTLMVMKKLKEKSVGDDLNISDVQGREELVLGFDQLLHEVVVKDILKIQCEDEVSSAGQIKQGMERRQIDLAG
jgi:hypothetical protein